MGRPASTRRDGESPRRVSGLRRALATWYRPRRNVYPWRRAIPDAYRVLVSEVMLQQTQASRVAPVYVAFIDRFPDVHALAWASRADVIRAWAGLGYNRRAVALSEAARFIVAEHGGRTPRDPDALRALPGVGPYTASAVASIAFGVPTPAIDVNVARVVARAILGKEAHEALPEELRNAARTWLDPKSPGAWNQALMDLGREVCRARPRCAACPLATDCRFRSRGGPVSRPPRRQPPFEGSDRQVRGAVVRQLRDGSATIERLAASTGFSSHRIVGAVRALHRDGLVHAGPGALAARSSGRARLP